MKGKKTSLLVISSIAASSLVVGYSSWLVSADFLGGEVNALTTGPIAYNKNTSVKYTNLNTALNRAKQGESIYVIPGNSITITTDLNITSGVSLYLPYQDELWDIQSNTEINSSSFIDSSATNVKNFRKSQLIMSNYANINIESGGNLYLGGIFGTRGTNSYYCEIALNEGSSINCNGKFYCYGYVKELSGKNANQSDYQNYYNNEFDQNRYINVGKGGYLKTALAIFDSSSAGAMSTYVNANVCPLNIIEFPNLQTFTTINYGATFDVQIRLALGSGDNIGYTNEKAIMVNSSTDSDKAMFKLSSGSISFEYCPDNITYTKYSTIVNSSPTRIYLHGNCDLGSLYFKVTLQVASTTVDTSKMFLPISHKFYIFICDGGVFNCKNDLKFLPGSHLTILKDGSFNVSADMMIYSSNKFKEVDSSTYPSYCRDTDASFINNGNLVIESKGTAGGFVTNTTLDNSAVVDLTNVSSQSKLTVSLPEGSNGMTMTLPLSGPFYQESSQSVSNANFASSSKVISHSNSGDSYSWEGTSYKTDVLSVVVNKPYNINFVEYHVYQADDSKGTNSQEITSSVMTDSGTYNIVDGKYFKVSLSGKEKGASFTDGRSDTFVSDSWFKMSSDTILTIDPNEGKILQVYVQSISGAGSSSVKISTSTTQKGTYNQVAKYSPSGDDVYLSGTWVKLDFTGGYNSNLKPVEVKAAYKKSIASVTPMTTTEPIDGKDGWSMINISEAFELDDSYVIYIAIQESCIVKGTLITMADGSFRKIEELKPGELILSYDFETGKYISTPVAEVTNHGENVYDVLRLHFDDESSIGIIQGHGFFDVTLKKYVDIDENNYKQYIGHEFMKCIDGRTTIAKLVTGEISVEKTCSYSLLAAVTINAIADGFVTITPPITDWYNMFEVGDDLKWDEEKKREDIEKYGLFEYDEVKDIVPYEIYVASNFKYYKVAFAKGLLTMEDVKRFLEWYRSFERNGEIKLGI